VGFRSLNYVTVRTVSNCSDWERPCRRDRTRRNRRSLVKCIVITSEPAQSSMRHDTVTSSHVAVALLISAEGSWSLPLRTCDQKHSLSRATASVPRQDIRSGTRGLTVFATIMPSGFERRPHGSQEHMSILSIDILDVNHVGPGRQLMSR
jgi:hypothetical protein